MITRHSSRQQAFTVLEMLIAMALGSLLIMTAAAGFRTASQAITTCNRLSLENSLLRAGFQSAHDELDFWTGQDDPDLADTFTTTPSRHPLRYDPATGQKDSLPFAPFKVAFNRDGNNGNEASIGWDPSELTWSQANPRAWCRVNLAERGDSDQRFGRYAIFSVNRSDYPSFSRPIAIPDNSDNPSGYGNTTVPRAWYGNQISGLLQALGYWGFCEYVPSNALYGYYRSPEPKYTYTEWSKSIPPIRVPPYWDRSNSSVPPYADAHLNLGGLPRSLVQGKGISNNDGDQKFTRGIYRSTFRTSYALSNPRSSDYALADHRSCYNVGFASDLKTLAGFDAKIGVRDALLPNRPLHWSGITTSVSRYIKNARHVALCRLRWTNPTTGEVSELSFTGFGTTLRGARQQRGREGGWADWDNKPGFIPTVPNLDSY